MVRGAGPLILLCLVTSCCKDGRRLPDGVPARASASYICADGRGFLARFDNVADRVTLFDVATSAPAGGRRAFARLRGQRAASGIWYKGEGFELRGKGRQATLFRPDGHASDCSSG